ncbi:MAG: DNA mismatch repair protein MutS [Sulfobacillus acidophilus]|uniref:DNA mismatch repair protein MutS n=1 Tax=Sulfobacillus acidophilus TaxID=53633 RepID=A0A2T2WET0_9FIRM|nr:MAG: DNA mismatch repair protein MutS [Sulfobacillus acidophilus]
MTDLAKPTPMLEQYWRLKKLNPDALLFFRLGDFYELFEQDAEVAAPILDLQLTSRDGRVAMCGVPYHAGTQYARRLLQSGFTVAIAEQMEDPATARGLVERQVVRILTPGTIIPEDEGMSPRLGVFYRHRQGVVAIVAELSTGTVHIAQGTLRSQDVRAIEHLWSVWAPDEAFSNGPAAEVGGTTLRDGSVYFSRQSLLHKEQVVEQKLGLGSLRRWGLEDNGPIVESLAALARYLDTLQPGTLRHLRDIRWHPLHGEMHLSARTLRQLDICAGPHSLLARINYCCTPMGSRRLQDWLEHPLTDISEIRRRAQAVSHWIDHAIERAQLRELLQSVGDLSRRVARVVMGVSKPRDVAGIVAALKCMPELCVLVENSQTWPLPVRVNGHPWIALLQRLDVLADPAPARWDDSPLLRAGVDADVDDSRSLLTGHRQALIELEEQERQRSQIKSLRVGYHRTFGYYIEVTKSQAKSVPKDWQRRQTTTHTERFVSDALKAVEAAIATAESRIAQAEAQWAHNLTAWISEESEWLTEIAAWLSELDVISGLAEAAVKHRYQPPQLTGADSRVTIAAMRHPVLEALVNEYIPSDLVLDSPHQALIITGPNMGGKSTFMRALAQNAILAQIGGWVAAMRYEAPVFDAVLTRMGADDDLVRGQSTFMVEMEEVAAILHQSSSASLVLLDELGRGTSTYDGLAIAQAVVERLALPDGPLTLFATHYHELTDLADHNPSMTNLTVEVLEEPLGPIFTHRVIPGAASQSYGIEVARQAGLAPSVLRRAEHHLKQWEQSAHQRVGTGQQITFDNPDPVAAALARALRELNPDDLSPREAWLWIVEWQRRIHQGVV